ncbi:MAG: HAD family hydrolase [Gammaproteobacteria bacterium]|nr:HAD-IA family hydrolase [Gammaproteobacteria bacterium]PCH62268.1 MAG: HAD family hydrolase [Gammaproteobacteria bacterium]
MNDYCLIVFDWDGTLMDSIERIVTSMQRAFVDVGLDCPATDDVSENIGLSLSTVINRLAPNTDDAKLEQISDRYRHHFVDASEIPMPMFPYATDMLKSLKQRGYLLGVATGKARRGLDRVFQDIDCHHLFDATRCADETESKPHPRMLDELMQELSVSAEQTLMVGDTEFDMVMAKNAGVDAVGVSYGVHERQRLLENQAVACLDSIEQLHHWFNQLPSKPLINSN